MERYLSTGMVARICQVSPMTIAKWIDEGALPGHTTPGGHRRVASSDLVAFLESRGMQVPPGLRGRPVPRVLVVHEDASYLERLAEELRAIPGRWEYRGATRGVDALVMIGEWRPDVVLLDLEVPDLDGLRAIRRLTEMNGDYPTRVVALVSRGDERLAALALEAGATDWLPRNQFPGRVSATLDRMIQEIKTPTRTS